MTDVKLKDPQNSSGPVIIKRYKVFVDRNTCIGCGTCNGISPKVFALDDKGKSVILETADQEIIETITIAAQACPVRAITVANEGGQIVYPI